MEDDDASQPKLDQNLSFSGRDVIKKQDVYSMNLRTPKFTNKTMYKFFKIEVL